MTLGDIGALLISLGMISAIAGIISYVMAHRTEEYRYFAIGRGAFYGTVVAVILASAVFLHLILSHQFQYTYIWQHTSLNLDTPYLFAAFYSGQEGSFLLWILLTALIGVIVLGYVERVRYEAPAMGSYLLVLALLLLILVVDSPFETIYASFADQKLPAGFIPEDGKGLNPQLENLWITIHPPILFSGFAAMTVPFAFAVAALIKRDYQRWITIALPWALFASMVLGFGIMLGGWWAYETLGWGGFWAWDPVENSSLIPWLICVALVHTMLVQRKTGREDAPAGEQKVGGLARTNFLLAILAFVFILYSTFLTRSGVLDDTSVHSFVTPGNFVFIVLIAVMVVFLGIGLAALISRWKELRRGSLDMQSTSRENLLAIGSGILMASAFIVTVGTSWPILMPLFGQPKAAVDQNFYNSTHLVLGIALVIVNALSLAVKWKETPRERFVSRLRTPVVVAVLGTIGVAFLGITDPVFVALAFGSFLSLAINLESGYRHIRKKVSLVGPYVSHAGVALLMLGIIFTARYSVTQHAQLVEGEPKELFGYTLTYQGAKRVDVHKTDRERYEHPIVMEKDGVSSVVRPIIFWSDFNERESAFREPGILYGATRDIYLSPKAIEPVGGDPRLVLGKGEAAPMPFDSTWSVEFVKFDMSKAASEQVQGALLVMEGPDTTLAITPEKTLDDRFRYYPVPGTDISVAFTHIEVSQEELADSKAYLAFRSASVPSPPEKRSIVVDVSIKPFISLVWAGVVIMVLGFGFSVVRRRRDLGLMLDRRPPVDRSSAAGRDDSASAVESTAGVPAASHLNHDTE